MRIRWSVTFTILWMVGSAAVAPASPAPSDPGRWETVAEATGFEATGSYEETIEFLERLAARNPWIELREFGLSGEGRPLQLVIVSSDGEFDPSTARASGKPIVMVQNGIHGGEIDGKDASLMLLRDLALGNVDDWAKAIVLLVVPIYNVDGHERVSRYNRPNQDGPVRGMGFRTAADGHDLNRDHLKLETPEARALIGLFNRWRPHLHVDNHVTDGSEHDWVLTHAWAEAPQLASPVDAWLRDHMPEVIRSTDEAGHRNGPYVSLVDRNDPSRGFSSFVGEPRYATGYYPLRNRASVLVENHSYKPFKKRVLANRHFMLELFRAVAEDPRALVRAVHDAEQATIAAGRIASPDSETVVRFVQDDTGDTISFPIYEWYTAPSKVLGVPMVDYRRGRVRELDVPWIHRARKDLTIPRPRGYLVGAGWPAIERRLADHGVEVRTLTVPAELEVETLRLTRDDVGEGRRQTYQGLTQVAPQVTVAKSTRTMPAGTLWIPADQRDFEVAVQLLEPEAPDSLVRWGLLSIVMERKEYIDTRVLEKLVQPMLDDPETAAEWERALNDETFAADPWARWEWWYRRTEFWDDRVGLMPVFRFHGQPNFPTEAWAGPAAEIARRGGDALRAGSWRGWLDSPGGELPFGLEIVRRESGYSGIVFNGDERIECPDVSVEPGRFRLRIERYDAVIDATIGEDGRRLSGRWIKTAGGGDLSSLPFHADHGVFPRFGAPSGLSEPETPNIEGRWAVEFDESGPAVGVFETRPGGRVLGTFLTPTGDYRYLAGKFADGQLRLSAFDGAHAFLFHAALRDDGTLAGEFWSRDSWHETWTARRDPSADLPDGFELTRWLGAQGLDTFAFPDLGGRLRSLDDPEFRGAARIIEIFGSWCPNCNDAAELLGELERDYGDRGLSILGLAYELTGDFERDANQVRRFASHHGLKFPMLIAGVSDKAEASKTLPLIDRIRSYPTTIFIDGNGRVRAVHQGFSGPATGAAHADLRREFRRLVEAMLEGDLGAGE